MQILKKKTKKKTDSITDATVLSLECETLKTLQTLTWRCFFKMNWGVESRRIHEMKIFIYLDVPKRFLDKASPTVLSIAQEIV